MSDPTGVVDGRAVELSTALVRSYTRGNGFTTVLNGHKIEQIADDIAAVIDMVAARIQANPDLLEQRSGPFTTAAFQGFLLPELAVLNRYRVGAL